MLYTARTNIAAHQGGYCVLGVLFIVAGLFIQFADGSGIRQNAHAGLLWSSISAITLWLGGFIWCYGVAPLRSAAPPFLLLICMVPIPMAVMDRIIYLLRWGSTIVAEGLFGLAGIPFSRHGFVFQLPTVQIEVAPQCSGIHSTLALFITGAVAASLFLNKGLTRCLLLVSVIPITVFKNGLRITVLSLLGAYGNRQILVDGWLHRSGGCLFFVFALLLLCGVIGLLKMSEDFTPPGDVEANR